MQVCHFLLVQNELDGSFNRVEVAMEGRDLVWVESSTGVVNNRFPIPGQSLKCGARCSTFSITKSATVTDTGTPLLYHRSAFKTCLTRPSMWHSDRISKGS